MLDHENQMMIVNSFSHAALMLQHTVQQCIVSVAENMERPSALFRPALILDGDKWCALYGTNLQDGVAGFGNSPSLAMADFDARWKALLAQTRDS